MLCASLLVEVTYHPISSLAPLAHSDAVCHWKWIPSIQDSAAQSREFELCPCLAGYSVESDLDIGKLQWDVGCYNACLRSSTRILLLFGRLISAQTIQMPNIILEGGSETLKNTDHHF